MAEELAEMTWLGAACAAVGAVVVPLLLHRIFFYEKVTHESSAGSCSLEEYMTKHDMSERDAKFQVAVDFIAARGNNKLTNEQKLTLYAFYKQAHFGKCSVDKPAAVDMVGSAKWYVMRWESWKALGDMNLNVAKQQYVEGVQDLFEEFDVRGPKRWRSPSASSSSLKATSEAVSLDGSMSMAGAVSMPKVDMSTEEWKVKDDVFHYASTGDLDKLVAALDQEDDINAQDPEGRTMLHWAVDRDQTTVVEELLRRKASPNVQDADGMTPLHYAASCEHEEMAQLLVTHGALVDIEDLDGDTPIMTASSQALQSIMSDGSTSDPQ
ncbi:acyl-CoA binding domain-containing protein 6 [Phytophthora pseudosyringae]|uniref:Acyl-CoA binding domain-containing protein 6 n=1 Tax=Phytophthora pseudosyringae TaxID=221518 RepID=A0A8T1VYV9_9STRA|nr:acyl-CoA binding domain-containing protein 6 [Phytophthora pseudosyringae]